MITHSTNYYGQSQRLLKIYDQWERFPPGFKTLVIDDGHPNPAVYTEAQPDCLARIMVDIPCNFSGTHNLAAALCTTPWLLHTEMDMNVTPEDAVKILQLAEGSDGKDIFLFDMHLNGERHETVWNWLMPTALFWMLGGHDEDFATGYGHDDVFFFFKMQNFPGIRISHAPFTLEWITDAASDIKRDLARNQELIKTKDPFERTCTNPLRFPFRVARHRP